MSNIIGAILILFPLVSASAFKDRRRGFACALGGLLAWQMLLGFILQSLREFSYIPALAVNLAADIALGIWLASKRPKVRFKKIPVSAWLVLPVVIGAFICLYSVHFHYTGAANSVSKVYEVSGASYRFPYFSDEWAGVAFSSYSLETGSLPNVNPLMPDRSDSGFPNIFVFFFALVSEILLVTGLPPLTGYPILALASGLLACLAVYLLLRSRKAYLPAALAGAVGVLYIANSSNLPGIWFLLPFGVGFSLFILGMSAWKDSSPYFSAALGLASILIYPPLAVIAIPALLAAFIFSSRFNRRKKVVWIIAILAALGAAALIIIFGQQGSAGTLWHLAKASAWRHSLDNGIFVSYPWLVVPILFLPFSAWGLYAEIRRHDLIVVTPAVISFLFWAWYTFSDDYFYIDQTRIVMIGAFFLVILAGFGLDDAASRLRSWRPAIFSRRLGLILAWLAAVVFLSLSFSYTKDGRWRSFVLVPDSAKYMRLSPAPPANDYLTADDYRLFSPFKGKRFLSDSWKGLVIGAATGNYPLRSKEAIVSNYYISYGYFLTSDCARKSSLAAEKKIDLVYSSTPFSCPGFYEIGRSTEGYRLYEFIQ